MQLLIFPRPVDIYAYGIPRQDPRITVKQHLPHTCTGRAVGSAYVQVASLARPGSDAVCSAHSSRHYQGISTSGIKSSSCTVSTGAVVSRFCPQTVRQHDNEPGCRAAGVVAGCITCTNGRHHHGQNVNARLSCLSSNTMAAAAYARALSPGARLYRSTLCSCAADGVQDFDYPAADDDSSMNAGCGGSISSDSSGGDGGGGGSGDGGDGSCNNRRTGGGAGDQPKFPAWYTVWMWCTAFVYLVWRWQWRRERRRAAEQFEREQQAEEQLRQDWQAFAQRYRSTGAGQQDGSHD